ncbi:MAG: hypothetical protein R2736_00750 [Solirubrobacterales bacterium]
MRDLMAIIARDDIISLAGGAPDMSVFPAEVMAKVMSQLAAEQSARALQYGPTEGLEDVKLRRSSRSWPPRARSASTRRTSSSRPAASRSST